VRPGSPRDQERAEEVHVHHPAELLDRQVANGAGIVDAGVVDDHVEAAEALDRRADDRRGAGLVGHRGVARDGLAAAVVDVPGDLVAGAADEPRPSISTP